MPQPQTETDLHKVFVVINERADQRIGALTMGLVPACPPCCLHMNHTQTGATAQAGWRLFSRSFGFDLGKALLDEVQLRLHGLNLTL